MRPVGRLSSGMGWTVRLPLEKKKPGTEVPGNEAGNGSRTRAMRPVGRVSSGMGWTVRLPPGKKSVRNTGRKKAGNGSRTRDIHLGKVALYH